jgi:Flp pilus assembly pilin Flp
MNLRPSACRGQAMTEYTVVLLLVVVTLIASSTDPSPIQALVDGIKSAYAAFSYVISFSV